MRFKSYLKSVESLATAVLLCRPTRFCEQSDRADEIDTYVESNDVFVVRQGKRSVGWVEDVEFGKCFAEHLLNPNAPRKSAGEVMRPIVPEHIVEPASTITGLLSVIESEACD